MITRTEFQQIQVALAAMHCVVLYDERYIKYEDIVVLLASYVAGATVEIKQNGISTNISVTFEEVLP